MFAFFVAEYSIQQPAIQQFSLLAATLQFPFLWVQDSGCGKFLLPWKLFWKWVFTQFSL